MQAKLYPLPLPLVSKSWIRDTKGAGEGGRVAAGHLLTPALQQDSPRALIHQIWQVPCHNWWITLLLGEHPCQSTRARGCLAQQQRSWGGWEGGGGNEGTKERRWGRRGGGEGEGWGRRERMFCMFLRYLLSGKNYKAVTLESHPHLFWAIAIIITLVIRNSLKDWQSMKKVHTCAAHNVLWKDHNKKDSL